MLEEDCVVNYTSVEPHIDCNIFKRDIVFFNCSATTVETDKNELRRETTKTLYRIYKAIERIYLQILEKIKNKARRDYISNCFRELPVLFSEQEMTSTDINDKRNFINDKCSKRFLRLVFTTKYKDEESLKDFDEDKLERIRDKARINMNKRIEFIERSHKYYYDELLSYAEKYKKLSRELYNIARIQEILNFIMLIESVEQHKVVF